MCARPLSHYLQADHRFQLLGRDGNTYRVLLRIKESAAGLSAVLDVTARVEQPFPGSGSSYSISTSEEIRRSGIQAANESGSCQPARTAAISGAR